MSKIRILKFVDVQEDIIRVQEEAVIGTS